MIKRSAFTLVEMLAVLILLAVVAGIMALLLKETLGMERMQAEGFDKILKNNALADQFRADVAQAEYTLPTWENNRAGPATLILQMPKGGQVIYLRKEEKLVRRSFEGQKETEQVLPVGSANGDVEFVVDAANPKLVRLALHSLRKGTPLPGQSLFFVAALVGEK